MDIKTIIENCISDRNIVYNNFNSNFIKKYSVDLIIKTIIVLINSIGIKNNIGDKVYYFVDEIKNNNMSGNLRCTYNKSIESGNKSLLIDYYRINNSNTHLKVGIIFPIFFVILTIVLSAISLIIDILTKRTFNLVMKLLILMQFAYITLANFVSDSICYLMTDHHFYSSILASANMFKTIVLQHGLILDKRFYYPIRASKFYAWGQRTKDNLNNNDKVEITGTYKFDDLIKKSRKDLLYNNNGTKKIMYFVSSLDRDKTMGEISILCDFVKKNSYYELLVKDHPGSLFEKINNKINDLEFTVYKEKKIFEIDFDLAVVGDSTVVLDLALFKKPFVYFEKTFGYFNVYRDLFLSASNEEELCYNILNYESFDFNNVFLKLYENELNGLKCSIFK